MDNSMNEPDPSSAARRALSCLMDGDDRSADSAVAFAAWRADASARSAWHAYHLIGDVLRSEDLALPPARDEAFLQSLRGRLACEPVPLAPAASSRDVMAGPAAPVLASAGQRAASGPHFSSRWMAPVAVAAGFVAVAGLLVVTRVLSPDPSDRAQIAQAQPVSTAVALRPAGDELVRNVGLDRYLEAHRSLANGVVAAGGAEHRVHIAFESK